MRIISLLTLILGITISNGEAQVELHVGATTSYNATFVLDKGLSEDPRYDPVLTYNWAPIGICFGADFNRKFGLTLEAIRSAQGQNYEMIDVDGRMSGERRIDLEYIHLPLLMKFMSSGNGGTRANFNLGPQLSLLTDAVESINARAGTYEKPTGVNFEYIRHDFPSATENGDGTYTIENESKDLFTKKSNHFRNTEFQIVAAFGLDIDITRHLFFTVQLRANYSFTDMRNSNVIEAIKNGNGSDIFGQRSNLLAGIQFGVHYMFGTTRSFKFKR